MTTSQYLENINQRYKLGNATEHTFRGDLQQLLESLVPTIRATNEPKRQSCGAPDYILTKKDIPVGFIEAKDIGDKDLDGIKKTGNKEQFDRYKASLNNLIFTDYVSFHLYRDGEFITKISIGEIFPSSGGVVADRGGIKPIPENFTAFENLIKDFCTHIGQTIKSSKKLAEMMAGKARLLSEVIEKALTSDENNSEDSTLKDQMHAFKQILIHDITPKGFADVYAQTIAYGMFAARSHDATLPTFSRQEAYELIPKSNPFLKKLFGYIAGLDVDDRIKWIVDDLVTIFLACNVDEILKNYGKSTKMEDPIIHFYETFLSEYDPKLRKARGVWYTPAPVVNFIVRAVDDILKTEFDLPQGLADTSKTKIKIKDFHKATSDLRSKTKEMEREEEVHRVQILDPATGTGTFLAEVIKHIHKKFEGQQGIWSNYVETHLLPRLNGFELLMASYAMAHLKLDLLLTETGYKPTKDQRFRVYLTNSLEESHPDTGTLFANWLSTEANEANHIKRDTPVMCIIGNPPYNRTSNNSNKHINNLLSDYKKDLNERNLVPLDDDYIKFIRLGQYFIDKNGTGTLAYISANSFLDGVTHRQMRNNLLESFDKIYILNLHGNAKKNEVCPDGSADQNVFDIMTGVSINIFVKNGLKKKTELGKLHYCDLFGKRELKYECLLNNEFIKLDWTELNINRNEPWQISNSGSKEFGSYLSVADIFNNSSPCIRTHNDKELIDFIPFKTEFNKKYLFKAFDFRYVDFDLSKIGRSRIKIMKEFLNGKNIGFIFQRGSSSNSPNTPFLTNIISDQGAIKPGTTSTSTVAPLYLYPETNAQQTIDQTTERIPNLNAEIVKQIAEKLSLTFTNEKETTENTFAPIDILDYIYSVLHSPTYREKYKEFLKIDFPRVPYPKDKNTFWQLVKLGGEIRQIHLLESPTVEKYITQYPIDGDNVVEKPHFVNSPPSEGCPQDGVVNSPSSEGCPQDGVVLNTHPQEVVLELNQTKIKLSPIVELPYNPNLKQRAKELRQAGNLPEVLFWMQVTKGGFHNIDFDRQRVIGNYIVDFYVKKLGLVIEIDGSSHIGKEEYDLAREEYLLSLGLKVYRIQVDDIMNNLNNVFVELENYIIKNYGVFDNSDVQGNSEKPPRPSATPPKEWNLPPRLMGTPPKKGNLGKVYINDTQYFDNVPETAWNFYIGGYQPAQKWLKDRKDRKLEFEDILHYQKIIVALTETDRLMKEIDKIDVE